MKIHTVFNTGNQLGSRVFLFGEINLVGFCKGLIARPLPPDARFDQERPNVGSDGCAAAPHQQTYKLRLIFSWEVVYYKRRL